MNAHQAVFSPFLTMLATVNEEPSIEDKDKEEQNRSPEMVMRSPESFRSECDDEDGTIMNSPEGWFEDF
jgi:hypothetical protein